MKKIFSILGLVAIALGGAWFVFGREPNMSLILQDSFEKTTTLSSVVYDIEIQAGLDGQVAEEPIEINFALDGALSFDEQRALSETQGSSTVTARSVSDASKNLTASLEHRLMGNDAYLRLSALELSAPLPFDLSPVRDYWYHLPFKKPEASESAAQLRVKDWLVPTRRLPSQKIDGASTWHFRVRPNATDIIARLDELEKKGLDSRLKEILRFVRELIPKMTGEIWIDKDDLYLRRLMLRGETDFVPEDSSQKPIHVALELVAKLSDFNKTVTVEAPSGARELQELLAELLGGLARQLKEGGLPSSGLRDLPLPLPEVAPRGATSGEISPDVRERVVPGTDDRDGDGLTDTQEVFWGSDPAKFDSDGDGYSDGEEVKSGHNPRGQGSLF